MQRAVSMRPPLLRALGSADPPERIQVGGVAFVRIDIFKHDSWAATARYRGPTGDIVCKFNRLQPIAGLPMAWLGRWLARRERQFLMRLAGLPGIPGFCADVTSGAQLLPHAVAHEYVAGHPLGGAEVPSDDFFPRLRALLEAVHRRGVAYVDLHKRENIVVGDDGRPHLVDFQVCFGLWTPRWRSAPLLRRVLAELQHLDLYSFGKHVRRHRPDQASLLAAGRASRRPWWVNVHRWFAVPLRTLRRRLLVLLGVRQPGGQAASEAFAEDAFRTRRAA
jgi:hypothetical protein